MEALIDAIKLLPFLFISFLIMEYLEHHMNAKSKKIINKSGKLGPLFGGLLGAIPQCGFAAVATNLYATKIITLGTLISIFLVNSDEMVPILISEGASIVFILKIIFVKIVIGIIIGFIIDFLLKKNDKNVDMHEICEHCHCDHSILKSSIKHTINTLIFIFIVTIIINFGMNYLSLESINPTIAPFITSLIGLIPSCGSSIILTELYLNNLITVGSLIGGLLSGSGVALLLLYRVNKNIKENIKITLLLYVIGTVCGFIINIF
jgi:hypothetical protein